MYVVHVCTLNFQCIWMACHFVTNIIMKWPEQRYASGHIMPTMKFRSFYVTPQMHRVIRKVYYSSLGSKGGASVATTGRICAMVGQSYLSVHPTQEPSRFIGPVNNDAEKWFNSRWPLKCVIKGLCSGGDRREQASKSRQLDWTSQTIDHSLRMTMSGKPPKACQGDRENGVGWGREGCTERVTKGGERRGIQRWETIDIKVKWLEWVKFCHFRIKVSCLYHIIVSSDIHDM